VVVVAAVDPHTFINLHAPVADSVLDTSVVIIGTLVALLVAGRYHRSRNVADLLMISAVILLSWVHALYDVVPGILAHHLISASLSQQIEVWGTALTKVLAGWYLVWASICGARENRPPKSWRRFLYELVIPAAVAVVAIVILVPLVPIASTGLLGGVLWPRSTSSIVQLLGVPLFVVAAWRLSSQSEARSDEFKGWLATGCIFLGFSSLCSAILPAHGMYWVRPGDLLRAGGIAAWAWGAVAEIRLYWSTIAESTRREALRTTAFDLHDGLAQELALLTSMTHLSPEEKVETQWHEHLQSTAERALAEARRVIVALAGEEVPPFEADSRRIADVTAAAGVEVRIEVDLTSLPIMNDPAHRESVVRIVREAVTNAIRHGHAGHISIHVSQEAGGALRISDDGVGFDASETIASGRFGLVGMREVAQRSGASLKVYSEPGQGTLIEVLWP
jgi:signal transduction histidine kinase